MARDAQLQPIGTPPSRASALRAWAFRTFVGRALVLGAVFKLAAFLLDRVSRAPGRFEPLDTIGDIALMVGASMLAYRLFADARRRLLWRVRRKLTLSYIFIGFIPAVLIVVFFVISGLLLLNNVSSYVIRSRIDALVDETQFMAQSTALGVEDAVTRDELQDALRRRYEVAAARHPDVGYAIVPGVVGCGRGTAPSAAPGDSPVTAGAWAHAAVPPRVPEWVPCSGFAGLVVYRDRVPRANGSPAEHLAARGIAWLEGGPRGPYAVVVDVPLAGNAVRRIREETGVTLGRVSTATNPDSNVAVQDTAPADRNRDAAVPPAADDGAPRASAFRLPTDWVAFVESTDWDSGEPRGVVVAIQTSVADIYERVAPAERFGEYTFNQIFLTVLAVVGGLLLIIQAVAFLMGLGLARSITGSVHELFVGTERVRRGDFTHKIAIRSRDQLGELAESFNSMTASIEDLLAQKAEKERLEQELRIARSIQMSLLPQGGLATAGFALTAHCEPAREVGGDYYDYLPIDADRMGILIADVSGKGTSAALYMAELKGIVLSLSQVHASPRELLIDANRILSRHLDSRSFITITYAVLDLRQRTLRYARAGHCPLIYMPGPYCDDRAAQVLTPDGMVVGLQLDEGQMFSRHLEEATIPFGPGDLFLLYTDGITEAMNPEGDCFGDDRLAALVTGHAHLPAEELRERILRDVRAFAGSVAQQDDMTMVLLRVDDVKSAAA